jgi:chromosome segregation ATPase
MDTESNAIPHPDPDTTDRVSDQLSLSQVATEVDLCMEPVTKYLTQHEYALRVYSLKLAKVETTLYNVDQRLNRKLAELEQAIRRLAQWQDDHAQQDDHSTPLTDQLQELTDRLDEVEYKADNPDEQLSSYNEWLDEYMHDNLSDAVQEILNRATVDVQARIIT